MYAKDLQTGHHLNGYDYGARYYDPSLARWTTPDPLLEWMFNNSPYNYVLNSPLIYIDPYGLFKTRIGAFLYKIFHGGKIFRAHDRNDEWFVGKQLPSRSGEAIYERKFSNDKKKNIPNTHSSGTSEGKSIVYKKYAEPWTLTGGQGLDNTIANEWGPGGNLDLLLAVDPSAGPFTFRQKLGMAIAIQKAGDAVSNIKLISDREIKESTGDKTDSHGRRVPKKIDTIFVSFDSLPYKGKPNKKTNSYWARRGDTLIWYKDSIDYWINISK